MPMKALLVVVAAAIVGEGALIAYAWHKRPKGPRRPSPSEAGRALQAAKQRKHERDLQVTREIMAATRPKGPR